MAVLRAVGDGLAAAGEMAIAAVLPGDQYPPEMIRIRSPIRSPISFSCQIIGKTIRVVNISR
jgi:hypothetical protein